MKGTVWRVSKRAILLPVALSILCILIALAIGGTDDVAMRTDDGGHHGRLCIPSAGVDTKLSLVHEGCTCCYMGLWNGGKIYGDAQTLSSVKVGDWADIMTADYRIIVECVEVADCLAICGKLIGLRGIVKSDGDVLLCVGLGWCRVRVYRMARL